MLALGHFLVVECHPSYPLFILPYNTVGPEETVVEDTTDVERKALLKSCVKSQIFKMCKTN